MSFPIGPPAIDGSGPAASTGRTWSIPPTRMARVFDWHCAPRAVTSTKRGRSTRGAYEKVREYCEKLVRDCVAKATPQETADIKRVAAALLDKAANKNDAAFQP